MGVEKLKTEKEGGRYKEKRSSTTESLCMWGGDVTSIKEKKTKKKKRKGLQKHNMARDNREPKQRRT